MIDSYDLRLIREEIKKQLNIILTGQSLVSDGTKCNVINMFPGMAPIQKVPIAHPYGFCSSALDGTFTITARVGEHFGARLVIGHKDINRPTDLNPGECVIYSSTGHQIRCTLTGIKIGSASAANPLVLGDILQTYLNSIYASIQTLYNAVILGTTTISTTPGNPTAPNPAIATALGTSLATLTTAKTQFSDIPLTNFLSTVNMTERGTPIQSVPIPVPIIP